MAEWIVTDKESTANDVRARQAWLEGLFQNLQGDDAADAGDNGADNGADVDGGEGGDDQEVTNDAGDAEGAPDGEAANGEAANGDGDGEGASEEAAAAKDDGAEGTAVCCLSDGNLRKTPVY